MTRNGPPTPADFLPDSPLVSNVVPAVNVGQRRNGLMPDLLLLHYTGMRSAAAAIAWLARADSNVSCHYVVDTDGRITQQVPEALRAWHAGLSNWSGQTDINSCSIGIEIQNPGHEMGYHDFLPEQMAAVVALSRDIVARHGIRSERVLAHSDVAPSRKIDPGEKFDWALLARHGVGAWVPPSSVRDADLGLDAGSPQASVRAAQHLFQRYGYDLDVTGVLDEKTVVAVRAFQRHFRPSRIDGRIDLSTLATLERLLATLLPPALTS